MISAILFLSFCLGEELDYKSANINSKVYFQVPKGELLFPKTSAAAPHWFDTLPLKGLGWQEPFQNKMIEDLRKVEKFVYVDYFTVSKSRFYLQNPGYNICLGFARTYNQYKNAKVSFHQKKMFDKNSYVTIPHIFYPFTGYIGISPKKFPLFEKHLWQKTSVYNLESLLNDPNLYTVQITGTGSMIKPFIYQHSELNNTLKAQYKKRVYDFVASDAFQLPLMLQGKRMDWVDITAQQDYYFKKLKIDPKSYILAPVSIKHPDSFIEEDFRVMYFICLNDNNKQLEKIGRTLDKTIKQYRTDLKFWDKVLKDFAKHTQTKDEKVEDFFFTQTMVKLKKKIDQGAFD